MAYRIETISVTVSHLQGHSYYKPFKCDFSYMHAAAALLKVAAGEGNCSVLYVRSTCPRRRLMLSTTLSSANVHKPNSALMAQLWTGCSLVTDRSQYITFDDERSETAILSSGVPQG